MSQLCNNRGGCLINVFLVLILPPPDITAMSFRPLGCFLDPFSRIFNVLFLERRDKIDRSRWPDVSHILYACARAAAARGYRYFSVQKYGQCRWGRYAASEYSSNGPSQNCQAGVGYWGAGFVYGVVNSRGPGELSIYLSIYLSISPPYLPLVSHLKVIDLNL